MNGIIWLALALVIYEIFGAIPAMDEDVGDDEWNVHRQ